MRIFSIKTTKCYKAYKKKNYRTPPMCKKGLVACRDTSREFFCYIMGILKEFLSSPSRNHLVISGGCIVCFDYIDVGLEISSFIEDKISDRRLSMRVQDQLNALLRSHICKSEEFGEYLALTKIGRASCRERV